MTDEAPTRLERAHRRWLGPTVGIVGTFAAVVTIVTGVRACASDEAPSAQNSDSSAVRPYVNGRVQAGWGPDREVFTGEGPSPTASLNSITDNVRVGDERNFTRCRVRGSNADLSEVVGVSDGARLEVSVFVSNASARLGQDVVNTSMRAIVDDSAVDDPALQVLVQGTRRSDGSKVEVWDSCTATSRSPIRLVLVPGTGHANLVGRKIPVLDDSVLLGREVLPAMPGYGEGVIPGDPSPYGFIGFDVLAVADD